MRFSHEFWWIFNQVLEEMAVSYLPSRWWWWVTQKPSYVLDLTAVPMYVNVTCFYATCRESNARLLLLPSVLSLLRATTTSTPIPIGGGDQSRSGPFGEENLAPARNRTAATP
jgi:hypothetical protein